MELLARYLLEIRRYLPASDDRDDVLAEIADDVQSELESRAQVNTVHGGLRAQRGLAHNPSRNGYGGLSPRRATVVTVLPSVRLSDHPGRRRGARLRDDQGVTVFSQPRR